VRLPFVTVFADDACEVQLTWFNDKPQFFGSLAACACVRRLAVFGQEFASARTPKPEVRLARAFEQQNFVVLIEAIEQGGDLVGQSCCVHKRNTYLNQSATFASD